MKLLEGKNILITGGSRGIGKSIVEVLFNSGANVGFTFSSSESAANEIAKNLNSSSFELENIYPEIFGSILPSSLKSFGNFFFTGELSYNQDRIKSNFSLKNDNGEIYTDLDIFDFEDIDNASYVGIFRGIDVDLSNFITLPFLGKSTFQFTIDGKGFVPELLNSKLEGKILLH